MPDGSLRIPDRDYEELRDIIPTPGLRRYFDDDGHVSECLQDISVDRYIQETRLDRFRSSTCPRIGAKPTSPTRNDVLPPWRGSMRRQRVVSSRR
jgi:hypothetical protein